MRSSVGFLAIIMMIIFVLFLSHSSSQRFEDWGVVLADFRRDGKVSVRTKMQLIHILQVSNENVNIELWLHHSMDFNLGFKVPSNLIIRSLNISDEVFNYYSTRSFRIGYLAKAYALLQTQFKTAIFFDSEVWHCRGKYTVIRMNYY